MALRIFIHLNKLFELVRNMYLPLMGTFYHQFLKGSSELELEGFLSSPLKSLPDRSHS